MKNKNIIEVTDFSPKEWCNLINETIEFKKNKLRKKKILDNKLVGLLFDNNSLRTRVSFEAATHLLGGDSYFISTSSVTHENDGTKRESYEDILETLDRMVDIYVIRDYSQELLEVIKRKNFPPFINGFCSTGHPSQALADLSVIKWKRHTLDLNYAAVCPSNGSGVIESFVYGVLTLGKRITIITNTGKFKGKNKNFWREVNRLTNAYGGEINITRNLTEVIKSCDVLYVDEWWENSSDFLKRKIGKYRVDEKFLKNSKPDLSILHCLPAHAEREITEKVLRGQQSIIFDQAEFRLYSAMSLLSFLAK